jgi:hypothetical protein
VNCSRKIRNWSQSSISTSVSPCPIACEEGIGSFNNVTIFLYIQLNEADKANLQRNAADKAMLLGVEHAQLADLFLPALFQRALGLKRMLYYHDLDTEHMICWGT